MDPLHNFPVEVSEIILQHLHTKELLIASQVSPLWNEFIGDSLKLMNNIKFLGPRRYIDGRRKYQNIDLRRTDNHDAVRMLATLYYSHWKIIQTVAINTWIGLDMVECTFKLPRLSSLAFDWINTEKMTTEWIDSQLCVNESIRILSFRNPSVEFAMSLLKKTPNVTHLKIGSHDKTQSIEIVMEQIIKTFPNLKSLVIGLSQKGTFFPNFEGCFTPRARARKSHLKVVTLGKSVKVGTVVECHGGYCDCRKGRFKFVDLEFEPQKYYEMCILFEF